MGATTFMQESKGRSAAEAFSQARERALHQHGHSGYSGTIAEKDEFVVIAMPADWMPDETDRAKAAKKYADALIDAEDKRVNDKWGPAGVLQTGPEDWLLFGWASC